MTRVHWTWVTVCLLGSLVLLGLMAPEFLPSIDPDAAYAGPTERFPFGADARGRPLWQIAAQGASIVVAPSLAAGCVVALCAALAGLVRVLGWTRVDVVLAAGGELVAALPRWVVVLVVASLMGTLSRSLWPIALTWAVLSAPAAMDEAAATAERIGGARFVEALRAHGFGTWRILAVHVLGYNLRPVLVRQGAEVLQQVVFLEIALSYLAVSQAEPAITHLDSQKSWADIVYLGYTALMGQPAWHGMALALALIGLTALVSAAASRAAAAR